MKKKLKFFIIIGALALIIFLFFILSNWGTASMNYRGTLCGTIKHINKKCYGIFCKNSSQITDSTFSIYWKKFDEKCQDNDWKLLYDNRDMLLGGVRLDGYRPYWLFMPEEYFTFLYAKNQNLLKNFMEYSMKLENERSSPNWKETANKYTEFKTQLDESLLDYFSGNETDAVKKIEAILVST